jgi:uncharacterized membrane protein YbhN (UPF0104 family)
VLGDGAPARHHTRRTALLLVLRVIVSAGLLVVLWRRFPHVDAGDLVPRWTPFNVVLLLSAAGLLLLSIYLNASRWDHMLRVLNIRADRSRVVRHTFAGQFVSVVLPSSVGGDVLRVQRLSADVGDRSGVFASVALERLTGWLVLPMLTICGFGLNGGLRHLRRASSLALVIALVTLGALGLLIIAAGQRRVGARYAQQTTGWRRAVWTVHIGIDNIRRAPLEGTEVFLAGLSHALAQIGAAYLAARVLGIDQVGPTALLAFWPAVAMLQVLPVAIGGLGVRESALALFLDPLGVPPERAVALGLLIYVLTVATSLVGAPAFALGNRPAGNQRKARAELVA